MGYCGLTSWLDSDNSADFVETLLDNRFIKKLIKQMLKTDNEFNTDGIIDVGLFLETFKVNANLTDEMYHFLDEYFLPEMKDYISKHKNVDAEHKYAFKRILKHAQSLLNNQ